MDLALSRLFRLSYAKFYLLSQIDSRLGLLISVAYLKKRVSRPHRITTVTHGRHRPWPGNGFIANPPRGNSIGTRRIQYQILRPLQQLGCLLDQDRLEATLIKRP
jgi:hypothetical protein